ncbi:Uu.00g052270.m01.CDS01 [Anthostomella pinea]|uniref:Uu.00g052270.m01.CDS01 n=1 Tax=Anthostomella pinea TaxID=933095 RepID=A0AAI8YM10_9PEZI|nr:Uu.00g052270.m01.CDS01 [Anthostomella pinea]
MFPCNIPDLPANRDDILCQNCRKKHDPRFCIGPLKDGRTNVCVRCGTKGHLFEVCCFDNEDVDDRHDFLYYPRQNLAPAATKVDRTDIEAVPGRHFMPVLTRDIAQAQDEERRERHKAREVALTKRDIAAGRWTEKQGRIKIKRWYYKVDWENRPPLHIEALMRPEDADPNQVDMHRVPLPSQPYLDENGTKVKKEEDE